MEWEGRRESENVEDRRMITPGRVAAGGGGLAIVIALVAYLITGDPSGLLNQLLQNQQPGEEQVATQNPEQEKRKHFVAVVLADTEDVWHAQFKKMGRRTGSRSWSCSAARSSLPAAWPTPRLVPSTAQGTSTSISTSVSSRN